MTGIDTNVLIRYIVQDDPKQSKQAVHFIETQISANNPGFINHIVLCEVGWVLKGAYGYAKSDIIRVFQSLLNAVEIIVLESDIVWKAVNEYSKGKADFSDYLIAHLNAKYGCKSTVTFDKKAIHHPCFMKCE
ncbi:type II toxin-antitoxin system VapC family toxin [bacterium]|nr:type II toxin-antitoxin system VapC family toxin [bacterium]